MYLPLKLLVFILACSGLVFAAPAPVSDGVEVNPMVMRWTAAPNCGVQYESLNVDECSSINSTQTFRGSKKGFCILYRDAVCTDRYRRVPAHACISGHKAQSFRCYHEESTWAYKWLNFFGKFKKPKNKQTKTEAVTASAVSEVDEELEQEFDASEVDIEMI